jgi:cytosine/adenosine deaminase-related metal-dependent hydrolase
MRLATIDGARAMGLDGVIGSLEVGKQADVIVVSLNSPHAIPSHAAVASTLVYSCTTSDVQHVIIDGRLILRDRQLLTLAENTVNDEANREAGLLLKRAGLQDV